MPGTYQVLIVTCPVGMLELVTLPAFINVHGEKPGINMTQAATILVKNTTDVLNFTPSVNIKKQYFSVISYLI